MHIFDDADDRVLIIQFSRFLEVLEQQLKSMNTWKATSQLHASTE
jgi:hypothetical protein